MLQQRHGCNLNNRNGSFKTGDELIATSGIFGGTASLFKNTLSRFGIKAVFLKENSARRLAEKITENTKLIFIETISNPAMDVPDIKVFRNCQ